MSYDIVNFGSPEDLQSFLSEVRNTSEVEFVDRQFGRKAEIPEPELIVSIAQAITAYLLAKPIVEKTAEKVAELAAEEIESFYSFMKSAIYSAAKYMHPRNRPITYMFVVSEDPSIELVARTADPDLILSAMLLERLEEAVSDAMELHRKLDAARIQLLLNEQGEWEFNYLLTSTGAVIGTEKAYSRRIRRVELLTQAERTSLDGSKDSEGNTEPSE